MIRGIYHSAAGMLPRYYKLISISNNLANAATTSFKADRRYFSTVLNNELVQPGDKGRPQRLADLEKGLFTDFKQGAVYSTKKDTDFALNGTGFFVVENPDNGDRYYTRDGRFKINAQHELVTSSGYRVMDDSGASIQIPDSQFFVDEEGEIFVHGQHGSRMMLADFKNPSDALMKSGDNLYKLKKDVYPDRPEDTKVLQSHLEASNVNVVEEMVDMIALNRNYESAQRALLAQDQSLGQLVNKVPQFQ